MVVCSPRLCVSAPPGGADFGVLQNEPDTSLHRFSAGDEQSEFALTVAPCAANQGPLWPSNPGHFSRAVKPQRAVCGEDPSMALIDITGLTVGGPAAKVRRGRR